MVTINKSVIDDIIKNWFPIIGIMFVVAGMSYLFYEGVWLHLNESGRIVLGFLTGVAMISGSYALEKNAAIIADAVLGGGLLMLYLTLIYGSRFETGSTQASIPETWALVIATLFTLGVAFFSYVKQSQYILLVGILGGYLTPFFIGESGGFKQFMADTGIFHYELPLTAFLIYFAAINMAIFLVASHFFLRGIGLLNSLGLFIGTLSLSFFMGGQFPGNAANIAAFMMVVVTLHIGSMCVNAKNFEKETDPYLLAGYLLPLAWFVTSMNSFLDTYLDVRVLAELLLGCAAIYFGGWHYIRRTLNQARHTALYVGGIISVILAVSKLQPELNHLDGPVITLVAILFGILYRTNPLPQRELSYFIFSFFGFIVTLRHLDQVSIPDVGIFKNTTLVLAFSLLPFLLGTFFPHREDEHEQLVAFRGFAYYGAGGLIFLLLLKDLVSVENIPRSFVFLTLPSFIAARMSFKKTSTQFKFGMIKLSLVLAAAGFLTTFMVFLERFSPFPNQIKFLSTAQSFVGLSTIVVLWILQINAKKLLRQEPDASVFFDAAWRFLMVFSLYLILWSTFTHEILALLNTLGFVGMAVKNFATTVWWVCLSGSLIFIGVNDATLNNHKNIGFSLLSLTILKILFVDLNLYQNPNFKIIVFLLIGFLMLFISYIANKKSQNSLDNNSENLAP